MDPLCRTALNSVNRDILLYGHSAKRVVEAGGSGARGESFATAAAGLQLSMLLKDSWAKSGIKTFATLCGFMQAAFFGKNIGQFK